MAAAGLGFWMVKARSERHPESQALEAVKLFCRGNDVNAATDFGPTPIEGDSQALPIAIR